MPGSLVVVDASRLVPCACPVSRVYDIYVGNVCSSGVGGRVGKVAPGAPRQSRYIRSQQHQQQQQQQADSPADEADHDQGNGTLFNMEM